MTHTPQQPENNGHSDEYPAHPPAAGASQPAPQQQGQEYPQQPTQPAEFSAQPTPRVQPHQAHHPLAYEQPTLPQPELPHPGYQYAPAGDAAGPAYAAEPVTTKHRSGGTLIAGLAIGALVGGLVGGGTAAIIGANGQQNPLAVSNSAEGTSVTITNPENTTAVSAIAEVAMDSVVTLDVASQTGSGSGSGVVYTKDGYIITNAHVVTMPGASLEETRIRVLFSDGSIREAKVVGTDPYADIAVVKVEADNLKPITVADSSKIEVGDLSVVIGAPFNLSSTVTSGVISALNRGITVGSPLIPEDSSGGERQPLDYQFDIPGRESQSAGGQVTLPVVQTDADINPGNSGGALLNGSGELVGVNVAIASTGSGQTSTGSVGLGFAIPANLASRVADEIIRGEQPTHGLLGATVSDSRSSSDATWRGGMVNAVTPGGAAEAAGIRAGDVIVSVDGVQAVHGTAVSALVRAHPGGSEIPIQFVRDGEMKEVTVTLGTLDW